ncbi:MAG: NAD(P)-binding protein, partial [Angustibacter sp.]
MGPTFRADSPGPAVSADLVVLGASVAGLAAARRASARGLSVIVLESSQTVGGLAASPEVAGVRVDLGSHRVQATIDRDLLADLQHLLGADLQRRRRRG